MVTSYLEVKYKIFPINATIYGTDSNGLIINKDGITYGRFFSEYEISSKEKVCIIGPKIAQNIASQLQESLNKIIKIGSYNFRVIGFSKKGDTVKI